MGRQSFGEASYRGGPAGGVVLATSFSAAGRAAEAEILPPVVGLAGRHRDCLWQLSRTGEITRAIKLPSNPIVYDPTDAATARRDR